MNIKLLDENNKPHILDKTNIDIVKIGKGFSNKSSQIALELGINFNITGDLLRKSLNIVSKKSSSTHLEEIYEYLISAKVHPKADILLTKKDKHSQAVAEYKNIKPQYKNYFGKT